jgi:hypothetical protein
MATFFLVDDTFDQKLIHDVFPPEATPARSFVAAVMTTVVRGATLMAIPNQARRFRLKMLSSSFLQRKALRVAQRRLLQQKDRVSGGRLAPYRATSEPDHRERKNIIKMNGSSAAPFAPPGARFIYNARWSRVLAVSPVRGNSGNGKIVHQA